MWTIKGSSCRWIDPDKYITLRPIIKDGKRKFKLEHYRPKYDEVVVSCLHPLILYSGTGYYINKIIKQYGIDGLRRMLRKPPGTSKGVQFCVQSSSKDRHSYSKDKQSSKSYKCRNKRKNKTDDRIEKSGYCGMNYCDNNATGVSIVTENC